MENSAYEIKVLDPRTVRFARSPGGVLTMEAGGETHPEVVLYRAFPLSRKDEYISVRTPRGEEIGLIERLADLDAESRREAERELDYRYLIPQVTRIEKIRQNPGMWVWELETSLGSIKLSMRNLHEHVQVVGRNRLMLTDIDGNRVEIADWRTLDAHSRQQLLRVM